jgi:hypothetical protein
MIKIEVKSDAVDSRDVKGFTFREQGAYAWLVGKDGQPQPYPVAIVMNLEDKQPAYKPGLYVLDPRSFFPNKYRQLGIGRLQLQPAKV